MAHIIFLHGPSSSGKSTLAKAIQARIEKPFWHISIDHLRDSGVLPRERFQRGDFDWKENRSTFFDGFHASLAAYAGAGNDLIVEHILDQPEWLDDLRILFAPHNVLFVGLHCPLDILQEREKARGDRPLGSAAQDFHTVHKGRHYDLDIHSREDTGKAVERVLARWRSAERCSDFTRPSFTPL
ncbi:MAG: AAA family ATPase [Pseudomonadota bacterium]